MELKVYGGVLLALLVAVVVTGNWAVAGVIVVMVGCHAGVAWAFERASRHR